MEFLIREAKHEDADGIANVTVHTEQFAFRDIIPDDYLASMNVEERAELFQKDFMARPDGTFYYVAESNGKIIGILAMSRCGDDDKPRSGEITGIQLLPEYWNKGYGRMMMDYGIMKLRESGYADICLWVFDENTRAKRFYEKYGFVYDGTRREDHAGKPLVSIRYVLHSFPLHRIPCLGYEIIIENGFGALAEELNRLGFAGRSICIVADRNLADMYAGPLQSLLSASLGGSRVVVYVFPGGEENKNLDELQVMYRFFLEHRLDRKSLILALGGGVTGDAAGFAAATYMRGLPLVQVPTTLLAQTDASIGGKVAVDFRGQKNLVGAFYQPKLVYINLNTLKTLPAGHFANGMAEIIKHGLILDAEFAEWLWRERERISSGETEAVREMLGRSCGIKAAVVGRDAKETGERELLNFGHTFGHAIESLSGFAMYHGQCVAVGMAAALYLSVERGYIGIQDLRRGEELMAYFGLPVRMRRAEGRAEDARPAAGAARAGGFTPEAVAAQMRLDKKTRDGAIRLILLKGIGRAYVDENVGDGEIMKALRYVFT